MKTLTFAHFSDLHILKDYTGTMMESIMDKMVTKPAEALEDIGKWLIESGKKPDFIVLTGDLVHEGNAEDYAYLKEVIEKAFGDIPCFPVLGNHDRLEGFRKGYENGEDVDKPLYYTQEIDGLRLIVLDSSIGCDKTHHSGNFNDEQFEFLEEVLEKPTLRGNIIAFHHPCFDENATESSKIFGVTGAERIGEIIKGKNVLAILSGHTHENINTTFYGIPAYTAESTAFGIRIDERGMCMTEGRGFNRVSVSAGGLEMQNFHWPVVDEAVGSVMSLEALKEMSF